MILAKQRVIDLKKSLTVPFAERRDNCYKYKTHMRNKKKSKVLKQRERILHNIN